MNLFAGYQRKALGQVKAHLIAKHTQSTGAGAVFFFNAGVANMAH